MIFPSRDTYIHSIYVHQFQIEIRSYYRTHYAQIEDTAAGRKSLLSDEGFQLLRGHMHVFSGLHGVYFEQRSVREEHIRVSCIIRSRIEVVLRIGCVGDAESRFIRPKYQPTCNLHLSHRTVKINETVNHTIYNNLFIQYTLIYSFLYTIVAA